ncbi:MAG: excinuclease ABC subunit C [Candidatus Rokubacteria bacterium RBG_16_73_20]|nr:MAG: excinuclease ABC subunit C [Candidatus Rokubacteria bacterium GWA2_73_35]OGK94151.1 MAG: excinuclease ABC subunit C [Candidatus Rokubacteria bacterium RBG_16_73_20]HBH01039.1 excinuclease ABC subunit C [Candidatus Rokubacteria bacterium]
MTLAEKLARVPDRPGVYLYRDAKRQVLYVGKAASLRTRVRSYFQDSRPRDPKTDALVRQIRDLEYVVTDNELEALMLEANLVRRHRPRYNIILRDDKHYPFLKLTTDEEFPRLVVARRVQDDGATYYGPFYPATAMRETLRLARQLFPLRTCSIPIDGRLERPCIQHAIHRCNAPCTGWETREGYAKTVRDVRRFLEGKDEDLALTLTREMEAAAGELKFERAAVLRDQIQSLNKVRERQKIISTEELDQDVIGVVRQGSDACVELFFVRRGRLVGQEPFFLDKVAGWSDGEILSAFVRQFYGKAVAPAPEILVSEPIPEAELVAEWLTGLAGRRVQLTAPQRGARRQFVAMAEENAALALQSHLLSRDDRQQLVLEELAQALSLPGPPNRIEGYDISNIQGTEQVGSLVVWENGGMKKDDYKRFRIRTVAGADDFAALREVLGRRFARALEHGDVLPDLVLIDGGRGQLNAGLKALGDLGLDWVPVAALAKREEEVYVGESLHPLVLDRTSPALHTLMRIRDEAHRFAITYHKKLRARRTLRSELDAIPGVGPTLRTSLLRTLGSARRVRESSVAELAAVPRVTPKLAQRIFAHFHPAPVEPAPPADG